jgi:hypothetical protein
MIFCDLQRAAFVTNVEPTFVTNRIELTAVGTVRDVGEVTMQGSPGRGNSRGEWYRGVGNNTWEPGQLGVGVRGKNQDFGPGSEDVFGRRYDEVKPARLEDQACTTYFNPLSAFSRHST